MCNQYSPFGKKVAIENGAIIDDRMKFDSIWDTQTVDAGQALVDFFPAQVAGSSVKANYQSIPLPGTYNHLIVGASLSATSRAIFAASQADAEGIQRALSEGTLTILADSNNQQLAQVRLGRVLDQGKLNVVHDVDAAGTGDLWKVELPPGGIQRLPNPIVIAQGQVFRARVQFGDATGIPADTLELALELERAIPKAQGE